MGETGGGDEIKISSTRKGLCQNRDTVKDESLDIPFKISLTYKINMEFLISA